MRFAVSSLGLGVTPTKPIHFRRSYKSEILAGKKNPNVKFFSRRLIGLAGCVSATFPFRMRAAHAESEDGSQEDKSSIGETDLLIVGPGVLGRLIAQEWKKSYPGARVVGQTRTQTNHAELQSLGIVPILRDESDSVIHKYPFVVFCAPPSGSEDYPAEVKLAVEKWNGEGSLLFTSSSAVYDVGNNEPCTEESPAFLIGKNPRVDRLISAENKVLSAGGIVVRLAGLYLLNRGAHTFWLQKGSVDSRPDHYLNLIHYEDAASLVVTALKSKSRGEVFMGCDNTPLTRQEIMDLTVKSGKFEGQFVGFTATDGPLGKKMDNSATRQALGWQPKYPSFGVFLGVK